MKNNEGSGERWTKILANKEKMRELNEIRFDLIKKKEKAFKEKVHHLEFTANGPEYL